MAIFGKQGLEAAALYLASLWALYGMKDAGFKDKEIDQIVSIASRKNQTGQDSKSKKEALTELRQRRYDALLEQAKRRPGAKSGRYEDKTYGRGSKFRGEYEKLGYAR